MKYWKHESEITSYIPPNHDFTNNRRMVSKEDGINNVEMIIGEMKEGGGAVPHSHDDIEQLMYILEGRMYAKIGEDEAELTPGYSVIIPKKVTHDIRNAGKGTLKFVLIYSPGKRGR
ncbi:cupin domain-containing protein [Virgibacillus kekensis]|uniref:Cupin domain-containing protein n=1 Tax=Virgibacillus kekensis TaxID=202261 RepID=A0ABV9DGG8_9BACI